LAASAGEEKSLSHSPKLRRTDNERQRVKADPSGIDAGYQKDCANELGGNAVRRNNRRIPIRREITPPSV
jgi:hypothetical protein